MKAAHAAHHSLKKKTTAGEYVATRRINVGHEASPPYRSDECCCDHVCRRAAAAFASLLPLQVSIVTLFLFAGRTTGLSLRYFLMRLPVRFGRSRNFFLTAFAGLGC
jgi:hypothetical protein